MVKDITSFKKYQWVKGQSGNPAGRPKGSRNITSNLKELLEIELDTEDPVTGVTIKASSSQIINSRLIRSALDGDVKAIKEIYDRIEGRPNQKLDITGDMNKSSQKGLFFYYSLILKGC